MSMPSSSDAAFKHELVAQYEPGSMVLRPAPDAFDSEDEAPLRRAIMAIRTRKPGLVAKQVFEELQAEDPSKWAALTVSQVKSMCKKVAKADVEGGGPVAQTQLAEDTARTEFEKWRDRHQDPQIRDPTKHTVSRPGLPNQGYTKQRGDKLGTAAERGDTQQVLKLLKKGVDPNYQNAASGVTPLGVACERGHTGVVRALLDAKASPEIATREGFRPIHIATQFGKNDVLQLLVQRGKAECNARCPAQDTFPLLLATNFNFVPCMRTLINAGASVTMKSLNTATVLHYAFSAEAVATLVAAKADVNESINADERTPLHEACKTGAPEVVLALLTMGADPEARDKYDMSCMELALQTAGAKSNKCAYVVLGFVNMIKEISRRYGVLCGRHSGRLAQEHMASWRTHEERIAERVKHFEDAHNVAAAATGRLQAPPSTSAEDSQGGKSDDEEDWAALSADLDGLDVTDGGGKEAGKPGAAGQGGDAGKGGGGDRSDVVYVPGVGYTVGVALPQGGGQGASVTLGRSSQSSAPPPEAEGDAAWLARCESEAGVPRAGAITLEQHLLARIRAVPLDEIAVSGEKSLETMVNAAASERNPSSRRELMGPDDADE